MNKEFLRSFSFNLNNIFFYIITIYISIAYSGSYHIIQNTEIKSPYFKPYYQTQNLYIRDHIFFIPSSDIFYVINSKNFTIKIIDTSRKTYWEGTFKDYYNYLKSISALFSKNLNNEGNIKYQKPTIKIVYTAKGKVGSYNTDVYKVCYENEECIGKVFILKSDILEGINKKALYLAIDILESGGVDLVAEIEKLTIEKGIPVYIDIYDHDNHIKEWISEIKEENFDIPSTKSFHKIKSMYNFLFRR